MSDLRLHRLYVVAAAALFSTGGAAIKLSSLGGVEIAGLRSGIAALALLVFVPGARKSLGPRVLPVAACFAATMLLFVLANTQTTAASTTFLQSTAPLYVLVLGPLLLKERMRRGDGPTIVLMGLGLTVLCLGTAGVQETAPHPVRGNLLAMTAGSTWAFTVIGLRRLAGRGDSALGAVVAGSALTFLIATPALWRGGAFAADPGEWGLMLWLGVFQIGLAYVLLGAGLRHVPALESSLLLLLEPVLSPVWAWVVHREEPGAWTLVGGALVLGATLLRIARAGSAVQPKDISV